MDATEAQLRFGASLTHSTDPSHPLHPLHLNSERTQTTTSTLGGLNVLSGSSQTRTRLIDPAGHSNSGGGGGSGGGSGGTTRIVGFSSNTDNQRNFDRDNYAQSSRREFLTYALSLMRSHSSEHRDSLPVLDITALRHIAYVVDGIVFYMRSGKESEDKSDNNYWADADDNENTDDTEDELQMACDNDDTDDDNLSTVAGSRHTFFQRSESTLCLGCPPPDPFNVPLKDALPLADQPHLLQPNACREDLFGIPKQPVTIPSNEATAANVSASPLEVPPTRLGLSSAPRASTGTQFDTNFGFAETAATEDEQTLAIEIEEKTDKSHEVTAKPSEVSASTSSASSGGAASNHNIYLQLKKKTVSNDSSREIASYLAASIENSVPLRKLNDGTFLNESSATLNYLNDGQQQQTMNDEDNKSSNAEGTSTGLDKRNEGPQDLSKSSTFSKMEIDSDNDLTDSETDARGSNAMDETSGGAGAATSVRPQIIVSARKVATHNDTVKMDVKGDDAAGSASGLATGDGAANAQNSSNSSSPSKSVIVRAGPSVSLIHFGFTWRISVLKFERRGF